ncbi:hypothetical protein NDN08_007270 [Rhodosorus marinus]|uniref:C2H2-type domain-containing protein n=1 Tax=Rhodosorus marinus TaxID=101924 RepID=A0AAV8UG43_9RHOD|nr:hypothetical protein NDN08_007270 [Rhodosorus marinus]
MDNLELSIDLDGLLGLEELSVTSWVSDMDSGGHQLGGGGTILGSAPDCGLVVEPIDLDDKLDVADQLWEGKEGVTCFSPGIFFSIATPRPLKEVAAETRPVLKKKRTYKEASCPVCGTVFFRRYEMVRHLKATHLNIRPHQCGLCPNTFSRKSHLQSHMKRIHRQPTKA